MAHEELTVILNSSSLVGGAFLLDFAGFSWIGGGLFLRPSCNDMEKNRLKSATCNDKTVVALYKGEITCPSGEPVGGIKVICGCSFGTWFLFMMNDWAGLRLIYSTNTAICYGLKLNPNWKE